MKKLILLTFFVLIGLLQHAVAQKADSLAIQSSLEEHPYRELGIKDSLSDRLAKRKYVHVSPYYFRAFNADKEYIALQLGKVKRRKLFLYVKVFTHNACIRDGEIIEFIFEDGSMYSLKKNHHTINCEGVIVVKLKRKDWKTLTSKKIRSFMVFTFQKDYTFHITDQTASSIRNDIAQLKNHKF